MKVIADMKTEINEIKNKIYEAEGLLELLQLREDKAADLLPMIIVKIEEARKKLSDMTAGLAAEDEGITDVETEDIPGDKEILGDKEKPAFCLNDRFRFRRALFGGSDTEFSGVMDYIATLTGFEEAEEYFYGELGFEPDNEDVVDFMEIIKNYFKA